MGGFFDGWADWFKRGGLDVEEVDEKEGPEPGEANLVEGDVVYHRVPLGLGRKPERLFRKSYLAGPGLLAPVLDLTESLGKKLPSGMLVVLPAEDFKDWSAIEGWLGRAQEAAKAEIEKLCQHRGIPVPDDRRPFHVHICGDSDPLLGDLPVELEDGEAATVVAPGLVLPAEREAAEALHDVVVTPNQRRGTGRQVLLGRIPAGKDTVTLGTSPVDTIRLDRGDLRATWPEAAFMPRLMTLRRGNASEYSLVDHQGPADLVIRSAEDGSLQLYWRRVPLARIAIRREGETVSEHPKPTPKRKAEPTVLSPPPAAQPTEDRKEPQTFLGETALLRVGYALRIAPGRTHRLYLAEGSVRDEGAGAHLDVAPGGTLTLTSGVDTVLLDGKVMGPRPTPLMDEHHEIEIGKSLYVFRRADRDGADTYHVGYLLFETPREDRFLLPAGGRRVMGRDQEADVPVCQEWWRSQAIGCGSSSSNVPIEEVDVSRRAVELLAMPHAGEVRIWKTGRGPVVRLAIDRGDTALIQGRGGQALRIDGSDLLVVGTVVFMAAGVTHMVEAFPRLVADLRSATPCMAPVQVGSSHDNATVLSDEIPRRRGRPAGVDTLGQLDEDTYAHALTILDSEVDLEEPTPNLYGRVPRDLQRRASLPNVFGSSGRSRSSV